MRNILTLVTIILLCASVVFSAVTVDTYGISRRDAEKETRNEIKKLCNNYENCEFCETNKLLLPTYWISKEDPHPNYKGHKKIAEIILNKLKYSYNLDKKN